MCVQGIRMILAEDCWHRSLVPLMDKIRGELGDTPIYLTFDIDGIDACSCPGTGNLTTFVHDSCVYTCLHDLYTV